MAEPGLGRDGSGDGGRRRPVARLIARLNPVLMAHALGAPVELPLSLSQFLGGASLVLVFSFFALGRMWRTARFEDRDGTVLPEALQRAARVAALVARALVLVVFVAVFYAALAGRNLVDANLAPRAVYVVFWVGFTVISASVGDVWRVVSPFDTVCAVGQWLRARLGREGAPPRPYPAEWGYWPAAALLFGFVWLELVYRDSAEPRTVAFAMEVYTLAILVGVATWGRDWLQRGEAFAVYFGLLAHMAPLFRGEDGKLRVRPPLSGLARLAPGPGLGALIVVALGSTSFDGLSRTRVWTDLIAGQDETNVMVSGTLGVAWMVTVAAVLYVGAMRLSGGLVGRDPDELVGWFLPSLVPITFAYAVAHYFSLLIFDGQQAVVLASDPLGTGADYFGTAGWLINLTFITQHQIAWVQSGAIVLGHVGGVVVAHDRAVARLGNEATRSQYPLLGAMVVYTVGGLALLFGR